MSKPECSVAIATSGNVTYFGISKPPESLDIANLPAPPPIGRQDETLGEVPLAIYPRYFDTATEIGFADTMFSYEGSKNSYGEQIAKFLGKCSLHPKIFTIVELDPNLSIFEHEELERDIKAHQANPVSYSARLRNRVRRDF